MSKDIRKEMENGDLYIYNDYLDAPRLINFGNQSNISHCEQNEILALWLWRANIRNSMMKFENG
jgi:hypothetical protein